MVHQSLEADMTRAAFVGSALACAMLSGGGRIALADQQAVQIPNDPGKPTLARVYVINRDRADAVPVTIQAVASTEPLRVTVTGTPSVVLSETTPVNSRLVRQNWEYRQITMPITGDPAPTLNQAGGEGWDLVGSGIPLPNGEVRFVLKRPR
jgi:hypothetical protein